MYKRVVPLLVVGLALWQWKRRLIQIARHAKTSRPKAVAITTWEGEGGALPVTGSQLGPDPAPR